MICSILKDTRHILLLMFILACQPLLAQQTKVYTDPEETYKEALTFFEQQNYVTAKRLFQEVIDREYKLIEKSNQIIVANAYYYKAVSALELNQDEAEKLLEDFINMDLETPYSRMAYYHLGRYYFKKRQYSNTIKWLEKVDKNDLTKEERAEYDFQLAYGYFFKKKFDKAKPLFNQTRNINNKYYYPSNYYYGYIAFMDGNFDEALSSFDRIKDSQLYSRIMPYYISKIYYERGQYQSAIVYLEPLMNDSKLLYYNELHQIIGLSYFARNDFDKAVKHLEIYVSSSSKVRKEDIYQLGYAYYQTGNCEETINQMEQLDYLEDSLGQHALYLLGDCYLKTDNKTNARSAFEKASKIEFDKNIIENSLFNFAKLSYELNFDKEAIGSFEYFIKRYPNSKNATEAKELLSELLLTTRNYAEALKIIKSIPDKSPKVKKAYQTVAYYRGIELFNDGFYDEALQLFEESLKNPIDQEIKALCHYWKGEAYYDKDEYANAAWLYSQFLQLAPGSNMENKDWYSVNALYGKGYSQMKQEKYDLGQNEFEKFTTEARRSKDAIVKGKLLPDGLLRYGDCSFMLADYNKAVKAYDEVISMNKPGADYAIYQSGMILGLQGKEAAKIDKLNSLERRYPASIYIDDAIFEIGETYLIGGKYQSAINYFDKLAREYKGKSPLIGKAYTSLGLIYFNMDNNKKALEYYNKVIDLNPKSDDARQVLPNIRDVAIAMGDISIYQDAVRRVGLELANSEVDSLSYRAAEEQYFDGNYAAAISLFSDYISNFSNGYYILNAHYYRGEAYYIDKKYERSLPDYTFTIDQGQSSFLETALQKASWIVFYQIKDYSRADSYYRLLRENASTKPNIYAANLGLMRTGYILENFTQVEKFANAILASDAADANHLVEAKFYLGKIALRNEDLPTALNYFKEVTSSGVNSVRGAEALFRIAEIHHLQGEYAQSRSDCFTLIEDAPSYEYWLVRSYILLGDNYKAEENNFQAKATWESVRDNYKGDKQELKNMVRNRLAELEAEEAADSKIERDDTSSTLEGVEPSGFLEIIEPEEGGDDE